MGNGSCRNSFVPEPSSQQELRGCDAREPDVIGAGGALAQGSANVTVMNLSGTCSASSRCWEDLPDLASGGSGEPEGSPDGSGVQVPSGTADIKPIIQAACQPKMHDDSKLKTLLGTLAQGNSSVVSDTLMAWWLKQAPSRRADMLILIHRILEHALEAKVAAAEKALSRHGNSAPDADFGRVCDICREALQLEESQQKGVLVAVMFMSSASLASSSHKGYKPEEYVIAALDRMVHMFRHSLLVHIGSAARNLLTWHEFVADTMLPPLDTFLSVLSCSAKGVMMNLLLVPDGVPPASIILKRENTLVDIDKDLPRTNACVISPYFESVSGTKIIKGRRVEGGEGHGPRKEFFIATSANSRKMMFEFHRGTGEHWFSSNANNLSEEKRKCFQNFGKLLVLALANRCRISFTLPELFFDLLLRGDDISPRLEDLHGFDDVLHDSLKKCLTMNDDDFKVLRQIEDLPSSITRADYVSDQLKSLLMVEGMKAVRDGFWSLAGRASLQGCSAQDIRHILCPTETLDDANINIQKVFSVIVDEDTEDVQDLIDCFWSVIDGFTLAEKKRFLVFLTGVDMPPEPGTERLIIQMPFCAFSTDEHIEMLGKLPQAHTCTNTIELPNYYEALVESGRMGDNPGSEVIATEVKRILGEKLRTAINETAGYELDATEVEDAVAFQEYGAASPPNIAEVVQEETMKAEVNHSLSGQSAFGSDEKVRSPLPVHPVSTMENPLTPGSRKRPKPAPLSDPVPMDSAGTIYSPLASLSCDWPAPGQLCSPRSVSPKVVIKTPAALWSCYRPEPTSLAKIGGSPLGSTHCASSFGIRNVEATTSQGESTGLHSPQGIDALLDELDDLLQPFEAQPALVPTKLKCSSPTARITQKPHVITPVNSTAAPSSVGFSTNSPQHVMVSWPSPKNHVVVAMSPKNSAMPLEKQMRVSHFTAPAPPTSVCQPMSGTPRGRATQTTPTAQAAMYFSPRHKQGRVFGISGAQRELPPLNAQLSRGQFRPVSASSFPDLAPRPPSDLAGQHRLKSPSLNQATPCPLQGRTRQSTTTDQTLQLIMQKHGGAVGIRCKIHRELPPLKGMAPGQAQISGRQDSARQSQLGMAGQNYCTWR